MKLFALTIMRIPDESVQRLYEAVSAAVYSVHEHHTITELHHHQDYCVIQAFGVLPRFQSDNRMECLYRNVASEIAGWIVAYEEENLLQELFEKGYNYVQREDLLTITSYYRQMIQLESPEYGVETQKTVQRRTQLIIEEVNSYLLENKDLNLDGFIRFRLVDYWEELREMAEYAVDEFLMDRQYQEFISLLKYFVCIQEPKIPLAHLIHKGGNEFAILNDLMEPIDTNDCDATLTMEMLEKDINFEDVIVSTLISVSPEQILIHTRDPEVQIIQTIMQIFEDRVQLCPYCRLCQNLDRSAASDYNKG